MHQFAIGVPAGLLTVAQAIQVLDLKLELPVRIMRQREPGEVLVFAPHPPTISHLLQFLHVYPEFGKARRGCQPERQTQA